MTLGENLQRLRKEKGLSQEDVAQKLFVSRQSVSKWELDQAEPGVEYLKALAGLYGVTLDELMGEAPPPPPEEPVSAPPPEEPEEEERCVRYYRFLFWGRTALAVVENLLFFIPSNTIHFPWEWIALLVGRFVRKPAVWVVTCLLIGLNIVWNVLQLFSGSRMGLIGLMVNGIILLAVLHRENKDYFHMPRH